MDSEGLGGFFHCQAELVETLAVSGPPAEE